MSIQFRIICLAFFCMFCREIYGELHAAAENRLTDLRTRKTGGDWQGFLGPAGKRQVSRKGASFSLG